MSDFEELDEGTTPRKRRRRYTLWLWLIPITCIAGLGALLYFQYGVWVHPIHEPSDLEIVEVHLNDRLAGNFEILSTAPLRSAKGDPLLRVKYRQKNRAGAWVPLDDVFCVHEGRVAWTQAFKDWSVTPD